MPDNGNLLDRLPPPGGDESFDTLFERAGTRIERIVSHGHASPPGFWYDQEQAEWVIVVQGEAVLAFADGERREMRAGDWVTIAPHRRHRVESTGPATVWLAVHVDS
ncbi:MAG: cupin 2 domain-containing protein [Azoarcus sp.]|uniref:Cupin 2 domain-containing protein n=1 Tax=Aromatoleum tolulyticum TaxID=34027 RepID=A0A1N6ZR45_9RHOO|nr:cupin domain-containing protein [Aromatoleum tolulyticum]MCK9988223.1 cupin 2 domain-containing protein [Azoarcus sp.]SIR29308.1 cupin 2 domain-containing protein [Aromatoleum tolulyticum]